MSGKTTEQIKVNTLYKDIFDEVSVQLGLKEAMKQFHAIQSTYIDNLDKFFHNKCAKEYEWIENNSVSKTLHLPKDNIDEKTYKKHKEELKECIDNNDKGYIDSLEQFKKDYKAFTKDINHQINECCQLKEEKEIKECIRDKYTKGATNLIGLFNKYEKQYNELNKKILL